MCDIQVIKNEDINGTDKTECVLIYLVCVYRNNLITKLPKKLIVISAE